MRHIITKQVNLLTKSGEPYSRLVFEVNRDLHEVRFYHSIRGDMMQSPRLEDLIALLLGDRDLNREMRYALAVYDRKYPYRVERRESTYGSVTYKLHIYPGPDFVGASGYNEQLAFRLHVSCAGCVNDFDRGARYFIGDLATVIASEIGATPLAKMAFEKRREFVRLRRFSYVRPDKPEKIERPMHPCLAPEFRRRYREIYGSVDEE